MDAKNAVALAKYKKFITLLKSLEKKTVCTFELLEENNDGNNSCRISGHKKALKTINGYLRWKSLSRFALGIALGLIAGIILSYILIPSGVVYLSSSQQGILPPQYDALIKMKDPHEQLIQIMSFECVPVHTYGGPHRGKHIMYADSTDPVFTIELWFSASRKSIGAKLGQKKGSKILGNAVQRQVEKTGLDSVATLVTGNSMGPVSKRLGNAVSQSTAVKIEKAYQSQPVVKIINKTGKRTTEYINFLSWRGTHKDAFLVNDAHQARIKEYDHVKRGWKRRIPEQEDVDRYNEFLQKYLNEYFNKNKK